MKSGARLSKPRDHASGILYMVGASLAFAGMVVCVKWLAQSLPVFEIVFFRSLSGTLLISLLILRKGVPFWGKTRGKLILRGVSGFVALTLHFYTISKLPIGLAVMLNYTAPIFAAILAFFFLKERPTFFLWTMISLSFAGIYLLTVPQTEIHLSGKGFYIFLGLLSGLAAAVAYMAIRAIKHRESPLTIIFNFTFISLVGSSFFIAGEMKWPRELFEWVGLLGLAIGSFYGQLWMTIAFRRAPASLVSPFSYLTPAFSFLLGFLFWHDPISLHTLLGAGLIILAGSWIYLREAAYE